MRQNLPANFAQLYEPGKIQTHEERRAGSSLARRMRIMIFGLEEARIALCKKSRHKFNSAEYANLTGSRAPAAL
jgi:hypothetical protein